MSRLLAAFQVLAQLAGFFALAVPTNLACCAGAVEAHGEACCKSASFDALARSCCEGGGSQVAMSSDRPQTPPPVVSLAFPLPSEPASAQLVRFATNDRVVPPDGGLFTLHSALLL